MSRITDALLFAVLLVVFATWLTTAFDSLALVSALFAVSGLVAGVAALTAAVVFDLPEE